MFKKLMARDNTAYCIDLAKVSCIFDFQERTTFIIDGYPVSIDMHYENAIIWLTSFDDS